VKVTVVGGGVIGLAVAYELAARSAQVTLIDPHGADGRGATRASAGMLAPYIEGHVPALLQLGVCGLAQYDDFVARVEADSGQRVEYRRAGTLQVAFTDDEAEELARHAARLAELGASTSLLDAQESRRLEPMLSVDIARGLLIPQHGYVAVPSLVAALARALEHRGAKISAARAQLIDGASCRVETDGGSLVGDALIVAAGSWSGGIPVAPAFPPPVRPIKGQLVHLKAPDGLLSHVVWGAGGYLVPWEDGSILAGATVEEAGFDDRVTAAGVSQLLAMGRQLVPALRDSVFHDARAGLRPATPDELPVIGGSSTMRGVFYATGHYRNGVLLAPLTALMVADLVLDGRRRRELELVRPDRFGL
jgi:glycine oxidase